MLYDSIVPADGFDLEEGLILCRALGGEILSPEEAFRKALEGNAKNAIGICIHFCEHQCSPDIQSPEFLP